MPSSALQRWQRERSQRLDKLFEAHVRIGGTRPGRRALANEQINRQINAALVLQLSAEFQGFARELYDELADAVMRATARAEPGIVVVLQRYFVEPRALDRGNAHPGALGSDFRRFGVELWPRMITRDQRTRHAKRTWSGSTRPATRSRTATKENSRSCAVTASASPWPQRGPGGERLTSLL